MCPQGGMRAPRSGGRRRKGRLKSLSPSPGCLPVTRDRAVAPVPRGPCLPAAHHGTHSATVQPGRACLGFGTRRGRPRFPSSARRVAAAGAEPAGSASLSLPRTHLKQASASAEIQVYRHFRCAECETRARLYYRQPDTRSGAPKRTIGHAAKCRPAHNHITDSWDVCGFVIRTKLCLTPMGAGRPWQASGHSDQNW